MVRAILEGRKTQTRRVVKPGPYMQEIAGTFGARLLCFPDRRRKGTGLVWPNAREMILAQCPYGQPGDRLWVRETFALEHCVEHDQEPPFNDGRPVRLPGDSGPRWVQAHYRATDPEPELCCESPRCRQCSEQDYGPHWRPSIHMPRWASRITLEVTGVRVERLHDITEEQARAGGAIPAKPLDHRSGKPRDDVQFECPHVVGFASLWNEINGADSWAANAWVWVVEFKRLENCHVD